MPERRIDWSQLAEIAEGTDSTVFIHPNGTVIKRYNYITTLEPLTRYKEITNRAAIWIQNNPICGEMGIESEKWELGTEIVPIQEVILTDAGPVGISKYVAGPKLQTICGFHALVVCDLDGVDDPNERDFLVKLIDVFRDDDVWDQYWNYLRPIPAKLDRALGISGFFFADVNVKVRADLKKQKVKFIVTDISDTILAFEDS